MRFDAKVLVRHDERRLEGERHLDGRAAAVALHLHEQHRAARRKERLQLTKRLEAEGGGAVGRSPRAARGNAVFDDGDAHQRQAKRRRHAKRNLERWVGGRAECGAQHVQDKVFAVARRG